MLIRTLGTITLLLLAIDLTAAEPETGLKAGAATSNITPLIGEVVVGGFEPKPSTGIHDDLHARALVLDDGKERIGIVVCDSLMMDRVVCDQAKELASESAKIRPDHILISATHTHSGPSGKPEGGLTPEPKFSEYQKQLVRRIADALTRAAANLEPARLGWGVGHEPDQVFNRRWFLSSAKDMVNPFGGVDRVRMNPPGGSPILLEPAGPTDPEVCFLSVQSRSGRPIALLANYSLHYVGGTRGNEVSADYFAMFADRIQTLLGADRVEPPFVGMMSNGTSGDINNNNFRHPRGRLPPYEQMHRVANAVAAEVYRVHQSIEFKDTASLAMVQRELTVKLRKPSSELLERAKKLIAGDLKPEHVREVIYAKRTLDQDKLPDETKIVLQAIRIGDVGIVSSPFETFCETGLELKSRSPLKPTFTIELANGAYGYLPTPEQHRLGGYETWLGTNRVAEDTSRKMTEELMSMLRELSGQGK